MTPLPTQFGSVIGWAKYYGTVHFFSAVLSYGGPEMNHAWWISGETEPKSPDELLELIGTEWTYLNTIEVQATI